MIFKRQVWPQSGILRGIPCRDSRKKDTELVRKAILVFVLNALGMIAEVERTSFQLYKNRIFTERSNSLQVGGFGF